MVPNYAAADRQDDFDGYFYEEFAFEETIVHYGTPRHSGRYPWGSGKDPYQHSGDFLAAIQEFRAKGMKDKEIAAQMGIKLTEWRSFESIAKNERKLDEVRQILNLKEQGLSNSEIGRRMGIGESSVRSKIERAEKYQNDKCRELANKLKAEVEKKGVIDIGQYTNLELGVSETMLSKAVTMAEAEFGFVEGGIGVKRAEELHGGRGNQTNTKVLCIDDDHLNAAWQDNGLIKPIVDHTPNSLVELEKPAKFQYPTAIDINRVAVKYDEQGGTERDGLIEIRRGVADLNLGDSHYKQVRIMVTDENGDKRYLKGMAAYSDNIPPGHDILFNTNKSIKTPKKDVLKKIKDDPDNPFGATIPEKGQSYYTAADGTKKLSAINALKWEGQWDTANSKTLSSQVLAKQPMKLIKQQLNLSVADKEDEFNTYKGITNPAVKQKILLDFADACDMAAVHMKAAQLPRQRTQVLLPCPSLKPDEIYAPNFKNGEKIAAIRYPHGGTFEIPILTVNNKNKEGLSLIGSNAKDAVGLHPKAAEKLSGADFDGDTAVIIPLGKTKIKSKDSLDGLKNFDPKKAYSTNVAGTKMVAVKDKDGRVKRDEHGKKIYEEVEVRVNDYGVPVKILKDGQFHKGKEMGIISNLITDMTLRGADEKELARAVRHSMVVIDAPKHKLDYKQSEKDNGIAELKKKYQKDFNPGGKGGASTLISMHKNTVKVLERKGSGRIDKETGEIIYKNSGRKYKDKKTGNWVNAMQEVPLLLETKDLHTLSSGTAQEEAYADYGNAMKALANRARKEAVNTPNLKANSDAKKRYSSQVKQLEDALMIAKLNRPRERQAHAIANSIIKMKMDANPDMTKDEEQKMRTQAIRAARYEAGASGKKTRISITEDQWEAIQAGALPHSTVQEIFANSDQDKFKELALPKQEVGLSPSQLNRIKAMAASGYTNAEIADRLGKSVSTVSKYLNA